MTIFILSSAHYYARDLRIHNWSKSSTCIISLVGSEMYAHIVLVCVFNMWMFTTAFCKQTLFNEAWCAQVISSAHSIFICSLNIHQTVEREHGNWVIHYVSHMHAKLRYLQLLNVPHNARKNSATNEPHYSQMGPPAFA